MGNELSEPQSVTEKEVMEKVPKKKCSNISCDAGFAELRIRLCSKCESNLCNPCFHDKCSKGGVHICSVCKKLCFLKDGECKAPKPTDWTLLAKERKKKISDPQEKWVARPRKHWIDHNENKFAARKPQKKNPWPPMKKKNTNVWKGTEGTDWSVKGTKKVTKAFTGTQSKDWSAEGRKRKKSKEWTSTSDFRKAKGYKTNEKQDFIAADQKKVEDENEAMNEKME